MKGARQLATAAALFAAAALPAIAGSTGAASGKEAAVAVPAGKFRAGAAAIPVTPAGQNPEWDGWVNPKTGIWSEPYTDQNANGRWDPGEPFEDDPYNTLLDPGSAGKFDGIWMGGFGGDRAAKGVHDDLWARALVLDDGQTRVALVALDFVGWFFEDVERIRALLDPAWKIDLLIVAGTHNHQSPDTMGLWGQTVPLDGKFPRYMEFARRQVVRAIGDAVETLGPAMVRVTEAPTDPLLVTDFRDPLLHDDLIRVMQVADLEGQTIATLANYSSHAESLGGANTFLTSDYPHFLRARLEERLGGTAVFFAGAVGGILGPLTQFGEVDGKPPWQIPLRDEECRPVEGGFAEHDTFDKARSIGCSVADTAVDALEAAGHEAWFRPKVIQTRTRELVLPNDNWVLRALNGAGMFDKPTYTARLLPAGPTVVGDYFKTEMAYVRLGKRADIMTVPGELFPEMANGGYGRPNCPDAHTGAPFEPPIRPHMHGEVRFVLGLGQDELGYIVPKYDYYMSGFPTNDLRLINFLSAYPDEREIGHGAADPCGYEKGDRHYEETVSGSSVLAPAVACAALELTGHDPRKHEACSRANMRGRPLGLQQATPIDEELERIWRGDG